LLIEPKELVDVVLIWALVWFGLVWLRTNPARPALVGLAILGVVFLIARQLGLVMITWVLQGFFAVSVLIAVVVFQQELRRLFEQIATFGSLGRRRAPAGVEAVDVLVRSLSTLVQQQRGALVVIPGREPLERHLDGGVVLDARLSEPLMLSLFDPHSPGHDGAILLAGDRIARFAVHLPLSTNHAQLGHRGTRHAAALGLSERADALCIVVSEEHGTVSVASGGRLDTLSSAQAAGERMSGFLAEISPDAGTQSRAWKGIMRRWREGLVALPVAAALWLLAVPGAGLGEAEHVAPIRIMGLPEGYALDATEPTSALVVVRARRRDLLLLDTDELEVRVDAILVELGRRSFQISETNVLHPDGVEVVRVDPTSVKISLRRDTGRSGEVTGPR
jgi:uncharacterized protein (TIGR00159 family)